MAKNPSFRFALVPLRMSERASRRTHVLGASRSHSVGAFVNLVADEISSAEAFPDGYVCEPSRAIRCGGLIHEGLRDPATIALGRSGGSGAACQAADSPALVRAH